jgi:hypothetical protein
MLYLIFYYILITGICLWAGILIYSFIPSNLVRRSPVHFLITGLIGMTAIGQWIVLFFPLNILRLPGILLLCGLISFFRRKRISKTCGAGQFHLRNKSALFYICLLCMIVMVLIMNAGPVIMDDTDSYHVQMVKWVQEFGTVPGIANLHLRFGFNSSWFSSIGLMTYPISGLNTYISLNGLLSVWFCYFLLERIFTFIGSTNNGKMDLSALGCLIILLLCLLNWPLIRGSACSANYDFISTFCIIVLFTDLATKPKEIPVEWFIWPVYLFTIRLMNFPLLILSLVCIFHYLRPISLRKLVLMMLIGGFIIIPFLVRNVILSGYPFFPVYQLDFFSFDWKADKTKLLEISNYIKYFNRVNPMFQSISITEKLEFPNWIPVWYKYLFRVDKLILTLSFFGYAFVLFSLKKIKDRLSRAFLLVMFCQLIVWFFVGPDPRFVYGPLLFGIFAAITCLPNLNLPLAGTMKYSVLLTSFLVLIYGTSKVVRDREYRNFSTPRPIPVPAVQTIQVGHIQMYIPEKILNNWNPRCYDIDLPCLYKLDPRLEARGERIRDGFRLKRQGSNTFTGGEYKISE